MKQHLIKIDGKVYISSKRASQLFGYTIDYIGQLARGEKIESKMIGRSWYVSQDSLNKHREEVASQNQAPAISPAHTIVLKKPSDRADGLKKDKEAPQGDELKGAKKNFAEENNSRSLTPFNVPAGPLALVALSLLLLFTPALAKWGDDFFENEASVVGSASDFSKKEKISGDAFNLEAGVAFSDLKKKSEAVDQKLFDYLDTAEVKLGEFGKIVWEKTKNFFGAIKEILVGEPEVTQVVIQETATTTVPLASQTPSGFVSEEDLKNYINETVQEEIAAIKADTSSSERQGIAVVPSSGERLSDEEIKQRIRNSFSDEVAVSLDESRSAGIVRPIFRSSTDDQYVFVLVPIEE